MTSLCSRKFFMSLSRNLEKVLLNLSPGYSVSYRTEVQYSILSYLSMLLVPRRVIKYILMSPNVNLIRQG